MQNAITNHTKAQSETSANWTTIRAALMLLVFIVLPSVLHAQFRASLRGVVTDSTGAVVPGATVTLTNKATNETQTAKSDANGFYIFNALPAADLSLRVEAPGFQSKLLAKVVIIPEQLNSLNVEMQVGEVASTVTVRETTRALDTETATVSATITSDQIQHLPSFNRDVFQLAQLAPGVFGDAAQSGGGGTFNNPGNQGPGGSGGGSSIFSTENGPQIQTRGGQYETNGITVDGISTVSAVWGGTTVITPSEDSIDNMKVVSNSYDAENGRFSGALIQVQSKSGTNALHGSLFFKASRPGLNAYQRWNGPGSNKSGTAAERGVNRDNNRFNQYGGSLGGPIWKNKIFAFFNYESSPLAGTLTSQGWYETPQFLALAFPNGSIASKYATFPGEGVSSNALVARTCASIGLSEGVNCATLAGGLDLGSPLKTGLGMQDLTFGGSSNNPGVGGGLDGIPDLAFFNTVNPTTTSQQQYNGRLDGDITSKDHLTFTIYWVPVSNVNFNGPTRSANLWHHSQINDAFAVILNHVFSPTLLNQARANAAGWRWNEVSTNPQAPFGLPQANFDNLGSANPQFLGAPGPSNLNQWTYDYNDIVTKVWGRHDIKVGGEFTRLQYLNNPVYAARPSFNFHNLWDFANDAPYFESGQFDAATGVPFANRQDNRENLWGAFVQDDYKLRSNLTINLGLRWSYFGAFYTKQNNLDVLRTGSGLDTLTGLNVRVGGKLYTPQKTNFGPQIGFAWQPKQNEGRLVVRGGYGIFYNQNEIAITANGNGNPPNAVNANFTCPFPFTTNPTCANTGILYETATSPRSLFGYAPNPATVTTFGPNNLPTSGSPIGVIGFQANPKTISNYHYSLDTQYLFPANLVFSLGYQGSQTRHLLTQSNLNVVAGLAGAPLNPRVSRVGFWTNNGTGNYNALITTLSHNFSHGFQAEAQYTWSKSMDENSGPYSEDPYPFNSHAAYGRSDYNVTDAFKLFGQWQPTLFHGHNALERIAGGWTLSGIWNVHSGFPWNPIYNTNGVYYQGSDYGALRPAANLGGYGTSTSNSAYKANINPNFNGNGTTFFAAPSYVQGAAFPNISPAPQPGIHRNSLQAPGYNGLDASLAKAFGLPAMKVLGEGAKFEIRADAYNLFNKTNIDATSIDTNLGSVSPSGAITPNPDFGVAGRALGSRTVQLQARFSF